MVGLALFAVFAFSAIVATSAFAGEWLWEGNPISSELSVDSEGELLLTFLESGVVLIEILCSGLFEGTGSAGGKALITDLWSLGSPQEVIGSLGDLNEKALGCLVEGTAGGLTDCALNELAAITLDNLNLELGAAWELTIELMAAGTEEFLIDFPSYAGYDIECLTPLGTLSLLCEGLTSGRLTNNATAKDVEVLFGTGPGSEALGCFGGPNLTADVSNEGLTLWLITHTGGGTLAVS